MLTFPSLLEPAERAFESHESCTDLWDACYRTSGLLSYNAAWYDTGGDGMTKHSPSTPISATGDPDLAADWMASLAAHLLSLNRIPDGFTYLSSELRPVWPDTIRFLCELKPSEKPRWINFMERKVSSHDTKRFDKRWTELPPLGDGQAIFKFLFVPVNTEGNALFRLKTLLAQIGAWHVISEITGSGYPEAEWLNKTFPHARNERFVRDSFRLLLKAYEHLEGLTNTGHNLDSWKHNYTPQSQAAA